MLRWMRRLGQIGAFVVMAAWAIPYGLAESAAPDPKWMTGEQIREAFEGQDLAGIYPNEKSWTEHITSDGRTDYREGSKHWRGEWWIANRDFCFSYPPPGVGGCFRVVRTSRNCFELYETTGAPGQAEAPPNILNAWNGRMWRSTETSTCERQIS